MASLSNEFSQLPPFGLMDILNHLIMSKTDYDKSKLSSWRSFQEYNLCTNGLVQSLEVNTTENQLRKKKLKRVINFTGSGLFWTQLGLCILYSVGARVELIKDAFRRKSVTYMSAY